MNQVKLLEEEKIKMVSITNDDLLRQPALMLDSFNLYHSQHTAFSNLLIEANHRRLAESTADNWRQRFEKEHRKLDLILAGEFNIKDQHKRKPKRLSTF